ncbi:MAG: nucleotidyltransferase domain-containing protein [Candidatus Cloacimonetes bacterium]|nr:nucleotidyltransferase domain-containing protein [Candidatus Cloacimonadota bacterium]
MLNKNEIIKYLKKNKEDFKIRFDVERIGLFGSYASNTQNENSDIDIIVRMPSEYRSYFALKKLLEDHFQKKIDIGLEKNLRLLIRDKIQKEIIYA